MDRDVKMAWLLLDKLYGEKLDDEELSISVEYQRALIALEKASAQLAESLVGQEVALTIWFPDGARKVEGILERHDGEWCDGVWYDNGGIWYEVNGWRFYHAHATFFVYKRYTPKITVTRAWQV